MSPEQIAFVRSQLDSGKTAAEVTDMLLTHHYTPETIVALLAAAPGGAVTGDLAIPAALADFWDFTKAVFARIGARKNVVAVSIGFSVIVGLSMTLLETKINQHSIDGLTLLLAIPLWLVFCVVSLIYSAFLIRNFLNREPTDVRADLAWAVKHCWSFLWVGFLAGLVMLSGFILFIIPGVVLMGYLMLVQPVRASENIRGINVLIRSTELVRSYWWAVFGRVFGIVVPVGFILGLIEGIASELLPLGPQLTAVLQSVFNGFIGLVAVAITAELYLSLATIQPAFDATRATKLRTLYRAAAWLCPVLFVAVCALLVFIVMQIGAKMFTG